MTRLVLDTNVWVSGLLFRGQVSQIVQRAFDRDFVSLMSRAMRKELRSVLSRKRFALGRAVVGNHMRHIGKFTEIVKTTRKITVISADPSDNMFLECAASGHADAIISGDRHLLDLKRMEEIEILSPAEWLRRHPKL